MNPGLSRRELLGGAIGASFMVALPLAAPAAGEARSRFAPNGFIRIAPDGTTTLVMPQVEMGQGVYTAASMILAEELDADFERVVLQHAPADEKLYANPLLGFQGTGNSNSIRAFWKPLRMAGASARAALVQAAAARWNVPAAECSTERGQVLHAASGRRLAYGDLVQAAAALPPPPDPPLKAPERFTLIGKSPRRLDTPGKVDGTARFGIDVRLPGMLFATVTASPVLGGRVRRVEDAAARTVPGVRRVVVLDDVVAVVGDHMGAAKKGMEALKIEWHDGANGRVSSREMWDELRSASRHGGLVARSVGDVGKPGRGAARFAAEYELPLLAHATMEPMNCTVHLRPDGCELWLGTQVIGRVRQAVAHQLRLPGDMVTVHNHLIGGGFGRRLEPDMAVVAARVAQQLDGKPVKVVWTREEDIRQDIFRPMYRDLASATMRDGRVESFTYKVCGSSIYARYLPEAMRGGIDIDAVEGAVHLPYDIPNLRIEYLRAEPRAVRTGFWRGVGCNNNVFAIECFMDELARKAGKDPIAFRAAMLGSSPRLKAAMELAAAKSGWGERTGPRVGRGVAVQAVFDSFVATVAEVEVAPDGEVRMRRITSVVDTGIAVHPDSIVAQLEGGLIFGLGAALHGEITVKDGRVEQSNFHDCRVLRMNEIPRIDIHLVRSGEAPGGIGEVGTAAAAPALRNAILAATGVPLRRLPIDRKALAERKKA